MQCRSAQELVNRLVDGEGLPGPAGYASLGFHLFRCGSCRAAGRRLRAQRRLCLDLPAAPAPPGLRAGVLGSLPPLESAPGRGRSPARRTVLVGTLALLLGGAIAAGVLLSGGGSRALAAEVGAAIGQANTWHLTGRKQEAGRQIPWEVWGRRRPYLYREQIGDEVLVDNGTERLQTVRTEGGKLLAVRTRSQRTPLGARWTDLTVGTNWARGKPWQATADTAIFRWIDGGMQGPDSVAYSYFFVDRRTKLPRRWEYRHVRGEREEMVEWMDVEYNVPVPPDAARPALPAGATLIDAGASSGDLPRENAQTGGGVTAQVLPVKVTPEGTVLARFRAWLGSARLDLEGAPLFSMVDEPIWARTIDGRRHPPAFADDRERPYVRVDLQNGSSSEDTLRGDHLLWMTPLEPLPPGSPLPQALTIHLSVLPCAWAHRGRAIETLYLGRQEFTWTIPLPASPRRAILPEDYMVPEAERRTFYKEETPTEVRAAVARAGAYNCQSDPAGAIRWFKAGIALLPPDSNFAQFLRGNVAQQYGRLGDRAGKEAALREIIEVKRQYPNTWEYYARHAQRELEARQGPRRSRR